MDLMIGGLSLVDDGGTAGDWLGRSSGPQLVFWREVTEPLPERVALRACEFKFYRDGSPARRTHASLTACPQPWLDR